MMKYITSTLLNVLQQSVRTVSVSYGVVPEVDSPLFGVTSMRSSDDDPVSQFQFLSR